MFKLYVMH